MDGNIIDEHFNGKIASIVAEWNVSLPEEMAQPDCGETWKESSSLLCRIVENDNDKPNKNRNYYETTLPVLCVMRIV